MSKLYWQIALPFAGMTLLLVLGLYLFLTRTTCVGDAGCVLGTILAAAAISLLGTFLLSGIIADRLSRPLRVVTEVARRVAAGDESARALTQRRDEIGDLIRAFGDMTEYQRKQIADLSQGYRRFAAVIEHMADGVLITDPLGNVLLINPAACRLLNASEDGALGRSFAAVVRHHQLIELWQRGQQEGSEQVEAVEISPKLFLQAVLTPYSLGERAGFIVLFQDLTQVRRLQVMRRDFISYLSHELRSPLASLRAIIETLQDGATNDPPAAERFLQQAESEIHTMTQMVEELTELSQIESGQIRLRLAPTPVAELVDGPLERLRPQAELGGLELVAELPPDLPLVLVDSERLRQVVTNLVHNAIKFTPPGGRVTIGIAGDPRGIARETLDGEMPAAGLLATEMPATLPDRVLVLEVRDTGVGISKVDLPRVFERFYKSDRARTRGRGGTGLGLAIARHIVATHGGYIWVKSKEGKGSSFFVSLPVAE